MKFVLSLADQIGRALSSTEPEGLDLKVDNTEIYPTPHLPDVPPELEVPELLSDTPPLCIFEDPLFRCTQDCVESGRACFFSNHHDNHQSDVKVRQMSALDWSLLYETLSYPVIRLSSAIYIR